MDAKQIEVRTGKRLAKAATYTCVGIDLEGRKRVPIYLGDLWRQCRDQAGTRCIFFEELRCLTSRVLFADWRALPETKLGRCQLLAVPT